MTESAFASVELLLHHRSILWLSHSSPSSKRTFISFLKFKNLGSLHVDKRTASEMPFFCLTPYTLYLKAQPPPSVYSASLCSRSVFQNIEINVTDINARRNQVKESVLSSALVKNPKTSPTFISIIFLQTSGTETTLVNIKKATTNTAL